MIYQNGRGGIYYMKRFAATGMTRDKEYNLTPGLPGTRVVWFTANPNGEAEVVKVTLKPKLRLKNLSFEVDFGKLAIRTRSAIGNLVTKNEVQRFSLKEHGVSTLGGRQVWFDPDVLRLNYDGRGNYLGEFAGTDRILIVTTTGEYYTTGFDVTNHYDDDILRIEKFRPKTVWTAVLNDADQGYPYVKRFEFEDSAKRQRFVGETEKSTLILLTDVENPELQLNFVDEARVPQVIDAVEYIGVKSAKARGKRLTTYDLASVELLTPTEDPEAAEQSADAEEHSTAFSNDDLMDDIDDGEDVEGAYTPSLFGEDGEDSGDDTAERTDATDSGDESADSTSAEADETTEA